MTAEGKNCVLRTRINLILAFLGFTFASFAMNVVFVFTASPSYCEF
jgi:hypothetical protein